LNKVYINIVSLSNIINKKVDIHEIVLCKQISLLG